MHIKNIDPGDKRSLSEFVELSHRLFEKNPYWIAPLRREVLHKLDPDSNPFFKYGRLSIYAAYDNQSQMIGRTVAIINPLHQELHGDAVGFFGLFECVNDTNVASALLTAAEQHLSEAGFSSMIGPVNLSTNDESGFLFEGFDHHPTFMCNYCHRYYHELMLSCGLSKRIDTVSYEASTFHSLPEKYRRVAERASRNHELNIRHFTKKTAARDIADVVAIYNESFRNTWGFVPLSDGEAEELAGSLIPFVDELLIWIVSHNGNPVGAIMGFPDINETLKGLDGSLHPINLLRIISRKKKITGMRIAVLGVIPDYRNMGIETLLIRKVQDRVVARPYKRCEFSVVMENNDRMRNLLTAAGFRQSRRFRIYGKDL